MPKEFISPSFIDRLCAPSCMQCRSPMTMALYPGLMLASYACSVCGMRDRAQIDAAPHHPTSFGAQAMASPSYGIDVVALAFAVILAAAIALLLSHIVPQLADLIG